MKDFIIIGAGLSGLNAAIKINELGLGSLLVLEKSRGVGGRMATRRTMETRFDHGAQFYRLKEDIKGLHKKWNQNKINQHWFTSNKGEHWCGNLGMTVLAKSMALNLDVSLDTEIRTIRFENNLWKLISKKNEEWLCRNLIISSPLPQTIKLLEELSLEKIISLDTYLELKSINYTKALIGLITLDEDLKLENSGYEEFESGDFFSISDQRKKGVSEIPALTLTMSPEFSEEEFNHSDELILSKILKTFINRFPLAKIKLSELKKWRYCKPTTQSNKLFLEMAKGLYLIGDAFGGSSLLGAIRSSESLSNHLNENHK